MHQPVQRHSSSASLSEAAEIRGTSLFRRYPRLSLIQAMLIGPGMGGDPEGLRRRLSEIRLSAPFVAAGIDRAMAASKT